MKLPNGYGSLTKLPGKRRKPWAIRTSYIEEQPDGTVKTKRKYIAYFEKKEAALTFLTEMNNASVVPEHIKYTEIPTFAEMYEKWIKWRKSFKNTAPGKECLRNYDIAFNHFAPLHHMKVTNIKTQQIQDCLNSYSSKSKSTIGNMRVVIKGIFEYSCMNSYCENNPTTYLRYEYTESATPMHTRFTDTEIKALWEALGIVNNVDIVLIYIYTGLRPSELLEIKSSDVHINQKHMVGGMKTEAGRNRIIPLHNAIIPLIERRLANNRPYLITNKYGNAYTYKTYHNANWNVVMRNMNMNHTPHDCRYTFASLADNADMNSVCKKIIIGHALPNKDSTAFKSGQKGDVTEDVYTEKTLDELLLQINKLPTVFN